MIKSAVQHWSRDMCLFEFYAGLDEYDYEFNHCRFTFKLVVLLLVVGLPVMLQCFAYLVGSKAVETAICCQVTQPGQILM